MGSNGGSLQNSHSYPHLSFPCFPSFRPSRSLAISRTCPTPPCPPVPSTRVGLSKLCLGFKAQLLQKGFSNPWVLPSWDPW